MLGRSLPTCRNLPGHVRGVLPFCLSLRGAAHIARGGSRPRRWDLAFVRARPTQPSLVADPQPSAPSRSYRTFVKRFFSDGFTNPL